MESYVSFLTELLRPLGTYSLEEGSLSKSELDAAGAALDGCDALLDKAEREAILATAEDEGLEKWASLFALRPVDAGAELRRAALTALTQIGGDSFTLSAINHAIQGCGITAQAVELAEQGRVRIIFPKTAGVPADFEQIQGVILELIPCHLETEFYFRYLTWAECEGQGYTWAMIHEKEHTWKSFQVAVSV